MNVIEREKHIPPVNAQNGGEFLKFAVVASGILTPHVILLVSGSMEGLCWKAATIFATAVILTLYKTGISMECLRYKIMKNGQKYSGTIRKGCYVKYRNSRVYYYMVEYAMGKEKYWLRTTGMTENFHKSLSSADVDVYIWGDKKLIYGFRKKKLFRKYVEIPMERANVRSDSD